MAWLIDLAIRAVCYILLAILLAWMGGVGNGIIMIGLFAIEWFYPVVFEIHSGMTPGKKAMGLQVVHDDGTPVSWSSSLLRNLLRCIDLLPLVYTVGFFSMILNSRFQRLGDLAAGTVVVYFKDETKVIAIPDCPPQPAPVVMTLAEQRLILDFCERAEGLSGDRRRELAGLLTPLCGRKSPEKQLLAYGNWFLKGKAGA